MKTYSYGIFILQMIAYLSVIPMIMYASVHHYLLAIVFYFLFGGLGMIVGYHRLHSHRSFETPNWFEKMITIFATLSLTGPAIDWVAIHRAHHKWQDTEKDPHSPTHLGWWRVHFLTMFAEVSPRFAMDLIRNKFYLWQRKYYFYIIAAYAVLCLIIDPFMIVYGFLFPAFLTIFLGTLILSTSHREGEAHDDFILGILTWGDAFHATHHEKPMQVRLHKYDIAGWIIETFFKVKS